MEIKNFFLYECKMFGMVLFVDEIVIKFFIKLNSFYWLRVWLIFFILFNYVGIFLLKRFCFILF